MLLSRPIRSPPDGATLSSETVTSTACPMMIGLTAAIRLVSVANGSIETVAERVTSPRSASTVTERVLVTAGTVREGLNNPHLGRNAISCGSKIRFEDLSER